MKENGAPEVELSVIAPMYNEEAIIRDSIAKMLSVLEQLPIEWELLLVNDGSTDRTLQIAREATLADFEPCDRLIEKADVQNLPSTRENSRQ